MKKIHRGTVVLATMVFAVSAVSAIAHEHASHARPQKEDAAPEHHGHHEHEASPTAGLPISAAPAAAELYIISPANGDAVSSPVRVQFGLKGMGVAPAGTDAPNTGHHHLLIDVEEMPSFAAPLPATDSIRHFGGGQTEVTIDLTPGIHSLQLVLGNFLHIPHNPPVMSEQIQIKVVE
ncbi:MAG: DUF4399 domain-containing protein [Gammaproteobacteria bacterium]